MLNVINSEENKLKGLIKVDGSSGIPLLGLLQIGVIDRGSSLLQVRASTACNMKCTFCSTSANSFNVHPYNFEVDLDYLVDWIKETIKLKNNEVNQINIDSVGEPTAYSKIVELIKAVKVLPTIKIITMQSNGTLLTEKRISELANAGLSRINLSVHSLDQEQSKYLFGSQVYNLEKIKVTCKLIKASTIELNITPVWLPGVNDAQIEELILFAKDLGCMISIQNYELFKYSRKEKKAKPITWFKFYRKLTELEKKLNYKLKLGPSDFNIQKSKFVPLVMQRNDIVSGIVLMPGWMSNEVVISSANRAVTVIDCKAEIGDRLKVKILETKNGIYIAKKA